MVPCILTFIIYCYFFRQAFVCLLGSLTIMIKQMQIKIDFKNTELRHLQKPNRNCWGPPGSLSLECPFPHMT